MVLQESYQGMPMLQTQTKKPRGTLRNANSEAMDGGAGKKVP